MLTFVFLKAFSNKAKAVGLRLQVPLNGPCEAALIRETNTFYISVSLKVGAKIACLPLLGSLGKK